MLRAGVLYRIQEFLELVKQRPITQQGFGESFPTFELVPGSQILGIAKTCGWIEVHADDVMYVTAEGQRVLAPIDFRDRLRRQIRDILVSYTPPWAGLLLRGRHAVRTYAERDAVQCFGDAELLDADDHLVVTWWDELAGTLRSVEERQRVDTGRLGERLSIEHEEERVGIAPQWIALENSMAGYDLVSRVAAASDERLVIEVKASDLPLAHAMFFISRHEWNVLERQRHAQLHLWSKVRAKPVLTVVEVSALSSHVPSDRAQGRWRQASIPFLIGHEGHN